MSGRGRGRGGRGFRPPTGAQLFLQRSAQESGLDERNLRGLQDLTRPDLFPDILWHSSGRNWRAEEESAQLVQSKRSQSAIYSIRKARELQHRMQISPYYLRPPEKVDISRHQKQENSTILCDKKLISHMGKTATVKYVPSELLRKTPKSTISGGRKGASGDEFVAQDTKRGDEENEEEDEESIVSEDEEEEDEDEDYTTNYYASDDESDGGDDGEPTI
mmetsp:Transcript_37030/g.42241  ORF Transcript_37030/g.42241 Transcript_37030/m.42241 type:complete len:219 (-) Transcript_37030:303-959(-)|eukprot:CAMPEP_0194145918 /NCGR_PEP_ID=MMETSP0152-20130528/18913_1 /TAXON_ID=1049557 /ORGANISM="Thalassiothrix antarctica, Strain L6-D1" /LENGTH=218 /DNA_ID=CAMNT_0038846289 /DNA_START=99 /DNA_END=758 /DNA_ORIENTATION=+